MGHPHRTLINGGMRAARAAGMLWLLVPASAAAAQWAEAAPRLVWAVPEAARGVPATDGDSVYFLTHRHELVAAEVDTGRLRWRVPVDSTGPTFGSRVVVRGDVVVAGDYDLTGVDRRTGRRLWQFSPPDGGGAGMHLGEPSGDVVFAGSLAGSLHAIDMNTGRPRWRVSVGDPGVTTVYEPVGSHDAVAAAFTDFGPEPAAGLVVVDRETGRIRWRRTVPGSIGASGDPVFAAGQVIVASRDGTIHAFEAATGEPRRVWPGVERLADQQDYRPLAVSDGLVIAGSLSGEVVAHEPGTGRVAWRRAPVLASVAFDILAHDHVVFVPYFSNQIVALRARDGLELWRIGGGASRFRWVPRVDGPRLFASGSGSFSFFRRVGPPPRRR